MSCLPIFEILPVRPKSSNQFFILSSIMWWIVYLLEEIVLLKRFTHCWNFKSVLFVELDLFIPGIFRVGFSSSNICSAGEVIESQRNCFSLLVVVVWTNMNGILSESPGFCHTSVFMVLRCTVPPFVQKFVKVFDYQVSIYG